jgi:hypothetical protein
MGNRVGLSLLLQVPRYPGALRPSNDRRNVGFVGTQRPIVQIGSILEMSGAAGRIQLDVEHAFRDDSSLSRARYARILNRVLKIEENPWFCSGVAFIDKHGPSAQQVAMSLDHEIECSIEQWMSRTDEGSKRLPLWSNERLFENDAFVAREHRLTDANQAVSVAHRCRHVRHLVAARFALTDGAAKALEGFEKEGLDIVRLKATRLGAFHFLTDAEDAAGIHGVVRESVFFQEILKLFPVERIGDDTAKPCANVRLVPIANGLDQQFPERSPLEDEF